MGYVSHDNDDPAEGGSPRRRLGAGGRGHRGRPAGQRLPGLSARSALRAGHPPSYAFDLLAFCRWLLQDDRALEAVDTAALLCFLASCQGLAPATVNRRLAAVSGLFCFRAMRDPTLPSPMPRGPAARRVSASQRNGLLGHLAKPQPRSPLRARQPRPLPRGLDGAEVTAFLASLRTWRDKTIAGLMLFSGLRSAEVLALRIADVDIARGWARVAGKGGRERRAPIDVQVAGWVQTYLLTERPDTDITTLFVVTKGPHRGQPLTPAGLRTIFRYHRERAGVPGAHPHALRHSFGTALAEAARGTAKSGIRRLVPHGYLTPPRHVWQDRDQALSASLLSFGLTCLPCLIHRNRL